MSEVSADILDDNEVKIRKQARLLAKRLLRSGELDLAISLVKRSVGLSAAPVVRAREAYSFLIQAGMSEANAWANSGMDKAALGA